MPDVKIGEVKDYLKDVVCRPFKVRRHGRGHVMVVADGIKLTPQCQLLLWNALVDYTKKFKSYNKVDDSFEIDIYEPPPPPPEEPE